MRTTTDFEPIELTFTDGTTARVTAGHSAFYGRDIVTLDRSHRPVADLDLEAAERFAYAILAAVADGRSAPRAAVRYRTLATAAEHRLGDTYTPAPDWAAPASPGVDPLAMTLWTPALVAAGTEA